MRLRYRLAIVFLLAFPAASFAAQEPAPSLRQPISLFGTSEIFSADSSAFYKWHGMMRRYALERRHAPATWRALIQSLHGLDLSAKIERANAAINSHPYVPSPVNCHESNYWVTPFEFLRMGGQCQDYAIAKYLLLREAGVPAERLRVVVLRDTRLGLDHAVTVAYVGGEALVLDNLRSAVVPASSLPEYDPYYSINEEGWWLHRGPHARYAAIR